MSKYLEKNLDHDGVDRRGFLKCMAWAGTGALCVMQGGVLKSFALTDVLQQQVGHLKGDLSFVQISDSHIGFNKAGQSGRGGDAARGHRQDQRAADAAGFHAAHRAISRICRSPRNSTRWPNR